VLETALDHSPAASCAAAVLTSHDARDASSASQLQLGERLVTAVSGGNTESAQERMLEVRCDLLAGYRMWYNRNGATACLPACLPMQQSMAYKQLRLCVGVMLTSGIVIRSRATPVSGQLLLQTQPVEVALSITMYALSCVSHCRIVVDCMCIVLCTCCKHLLLQRWHTGVAAVVAFGSHHASGLYAWCLN
jgi:hypothetical protein